MTAATKSSELQAVLESELAPFGEEALERLKKLKKALRLERAAAERLGETVRNYQKAREALLLRKWEEQGLGWCTGHEGTVPANELQLLYTEGVETRGSCHERGDYEFRRIERVCNACCEKMLQHSGQGDRFFAYRAEVRDGEVWSFRRGDWMNTHIPADRALPAPAPGYLSLELVEKWHLPPEMRFHLDMFSIPKLSVGRHHID